MAETNKRFEWILDEGQCVGCGACADVCPEQAIIMTRKMAYPRPVEGRCNGCKKCVEECPVEAITVKPRS